MDTSEEDPLALFATTLIVYSVPFVRPVYVYDVPTCVIGDLEIPPPLIVIVYPVIADPPLLAGADHVMGTLPLTTSSEAAKLVGAPGTVEGVADSESSDPRPPPISFLA